MKMERCLYDRLSTGWWIAVVAAALGLPASAPASEGTPHDEGSNTAQHVAAVPVTNVSTTAVAAKAVSVAHEGVHVAKEKAQKVRIDDPARKATWWLTRWLQALAPEPVEIVDPSFVVWEQEGGFVGVVRALTTKTGRFHGIPRTVMSITICGVLAFFAGMVFYFGVRGEWLLVLASLLALVGLLCLIPLLYLSTDQARATLLARVILFAVGFIFCALAVGLIRYAKASKTDAEEPKAPDDKSAGY